MPRSSPSPRTTCAPSSPQLHEELEVIALSHGNADEPDALRLSALLEEHLVKAARPTSVPEGQVVKLASGDRYVRQLDIAHDDSSVVVYFQGPDRSYPSRAQVALLGAGLEISLLPRPAHRETAWLCRVLHTHDLAGGARSGVCGAITEHRPHRAWRNTRKSSFEASRTSWMQWMSRSFNATSGGLLTRIMEEDKTISDRTDRYWREIDRQRYHFDSRERLAEAVERISKPDFAAFYHELLMTRDADRSWSARWVKNTRTCLWVMETWRTRRWCPTRRPSATARSISPPPSPGSPM